MCTEETAGKTEAAALFSPNTRGHLEDSPPKKGKLTDALIFLLTSKQLEKIRRSQSPEMCSLTKAGQFNEAPGEVRSDTIQGGSL